MKLHNILLSLVILLPFIDHSHAMTLPQPIPAKAPTTQEWQISKFRRPLVKFSIYSIAVGLTSLNALVGTAQTKISQGMSQSTSELLSQGNGSSTILAQASHLNCPAVYKEWEAIHPSARDIFFDLKGMVDACDRESSSSPDTSSTQTEFNPYEPIGNENGNIDKIQECLRTPGCTGIERDNMFKICYMANGATVRYSSDEGGDVFFPMMNGECRLITTKKSSITITYEYDSFSEKTYTLTDANNDREATLFFTNTGLYYKDDRTTLRTPNGWGRFDGSKTPTRVINLDRRNNSNTDSRRDSDCGDSSINRCGAEEIEDDRT